MRWFESSYPSYYLPAWRNWQTRWTQNPVSARTCRFDPGRRYSIELRNVDKSAFLFDLVNFWSTILFFNHSLFWVRVEGENMSQKAHSLLHTKRHCSITLCSPLNGEIFYRLCSYKGDEIIEGHLMSGHVDMLVSILSRISVSSFMGYLKGKI